MTAGEGTGLVVKESGLDPLIAKYSKDGAAGSGSKLKAFSWTDLKSITSGFGIEKSIGSSDSGTVYLAAQVSGGGGGSVAWHERMGGQRAWL